MSSSRTLPPLKSLLAFRYAAQLLSFEKAFGLLEEGVKGITEDPNPNTLVISSVPSFSSRWLVSRLGGFQAQEPEINLRLSPSIELSTFADSDLDLCIRLGRGEYAGLKSQLLFKEHLV